MSSKLKVYPHSDRDAYDVISKLPKPLNTILVEQKSGEYKDFHIASDDPDPMKGVTYSTNYGFLPGYTGEDGHELDFFVGTQPDSGNVGYLLMHRPDIGEEVQEHKFYLAMTDKELESTLESFAQVSRGQVAYKDVSELLLEIEKFKHQS